MLPANKNKWLPVQDYKPKVVLYPSLFCNIDLCCVIYQHYSHVIHISSYQVHIIHCQGLLENIGSIALDESYYVCEKSIISTFIVFQILK